MQFRTASMSVMLSITKHGVYVGIIAPCLVNFIMADMEAVQNCISAEKRQCVLDLKKGSPLLREVKN